MFPHAEVPAEAVEFPDQEGVTSRASFQKRGQMRPVIFLPGRLVPVELVGSNAGSDERAALEARALGAACLRDMPVTDEDSGNTWSFKRPIT